MFGDYRSNCKQCLPRFKRNWTSMVETRFISSLLFCYRADIERKKEELRLMVGWENNADFILRKRSPKLPHNNYATKGFSWNLFCMFSIPSKWVLDTPLKIACYFLDQCNFYVHPDLIQFSNIWIQVTMCYFFQGEIPGSYRGCRYNNRNEAQCWKCKK